MKLNRSAANLLRRLGTQAQYSTLLAQQADVIGAPGRDLPAWAKTRLTQTLDVMFDVEVKTEDLDAAMKTDRFASRFWTQRPGLRVARHPEIQVNFIHPWRAYAAVALWRASLRKGIHPVSLLYRYVNSPVGKLTLVASGLGLVALLWENDNPARVPLGPRVAGNHPTLDLAERQLAEYFGGKRTAFSLPLDMRGTAFQKQVWNALLNIPTGETRTYGQIAKGLGRPNHSRAVGAANARNPVSIIVPCHRVIGHSGKLTGFAGGLAAKAHLLALERPERALFK